MPSFKGAISPHMITTQFRCCSMTLCYPYCDPNYITELPKISHWLKGLLSVCISTILLWLLLLFFNVLFVYLPVWFFFLSKNWHKIKKVQWSPRNTTSISLAKNYLRLFVPTSSSLTLVSCMAWWISPCQTSITGDRSFRQSDYHLSKSITGIMSNQW